MLITEKRNKVSGTLLLDGYVVSRRGLPQINNDLIEVEYKEYHLDLISYIKGHFIIQLCDEAGNIHLYTDHIGIKKLFYWQDGDRFMISDNINEIVNEVRPKLSPTNLALHSLFHHFVDGRTMYEGVFYTKPASHITITNEGEMIIGNYWAYNQLLGVKKKEYSYYDFAEKFKEITSSYLSLTSNAITMTLTGGMDSRIVLGSLFANNIKPYAFTFGNENSLDVKCSIKIADAFKVEYNNYNFPNPSARWYDCLSRDIIKYGNSLVHIHRSHRLDALKREKKNHSEVDTIFLGAMGGEGIRGLHYDDLITTSFVRRIYENNEEIEDLVQEYMRKYFHKMDRVKTSEVVSIVKELPYIKNSYKNNQFYLLYELVASLHDTQDINLYYTEYKNVVTPFLDIDYLEMLFASSNNLLNKESTSHQIKDRLDIPKFHCNVSHILFPKLDKYRYSNGFSPREYLWGKVPYLFIRGLRYWSKKQYPPNFPYEAWFYPFVENGLSSNLSYEIEELFDVERAQAFYSKNKFSKEGYWHKLTNIIMYNMHLTKD